MAKKEKLSWTATMDDALVEAFYNQCVEGNKIDGTFTTKAYDYILNEIQGVLNINITKDQLKNRMKTLKKNYSECYDELSKGGFSGFSWNPSTRTLDAEPEVWEDLLKVYPNGVKWKTTPMPNYNRMKEIYGKDRATGERAGTAKEKRKKWEKSTNDEFDTIIDIDELVERNEVNLDSFDKFGAFDDSTSPESLGRPSKITPISKSKKKKFFSKKEEEDIEIGGAIKDMAGIMRDGITIIDKTGEKKEKEDDMVLFNALVDAGFEEEATMDCVVYLVHNKPMEEAFFKLPVHLRKKFLDKQMNLKK